MQLQDEERFMPANSLKSFFTLTSVASLVLQQNFHNIFFLL